MGLLDLFGKSKIERAMVEFASESEFRQFVSGIPQHLETVARLLGLDSGAALDFSSEQIDQAEALCRKVETKREALMPFLAFICEACRYRFGAGGDYKWHGLDITPHAAIVNYMPTIPDALDIDIVGLIGRLGFQEPGSWNLYIVGCLRYKERMEALLAKEGARKAAKERRKKKPGRGS